LLEWIFVTRLKCGMPIGFKDKSPRIIKWVNKQDDLIKEMEILIDSFDIINYSVSEEPQVTKIVENHEISINYVMNKII